jgi:tripartite-type tricarboxylate transporter receptor subunit TctC
MKAWSAWRPTRGIGRPGPGGSALALGALSLALGLLVAGGPVPAAAQAYPNQPIRLVIPFAPGGATDVIARSLAEAMTTRLQQPVVAENRSGASAGVGASFVARSAPDGYTVLVGSASLATAAVAGQNQGFDLLKDFDFVGKIGTFDLIVVTRPQDGFTNLLSLVERMRSPTGRVQFGSPGVGTPGHLGGELLKMLAHGNALHIPYKGESNAMTDILAGQITFLLCSTTACVPRIQDGTYRALAVAGRNRVAGVPSVPTSAEAGLPGLEAASWNFLAVPKGTPQAVVSRLNAVLNVVLSDEEFRARVQSTGAELARQTTPEDLRAQLVAEMEKWRPVIAAAGITN